MLLVNASADIVDVSKLTLEQQVERAGRCCYKSECKIVDQASAEKFCLMLTKSGHESVLEHASICVALKSWDGVRVKEAGWPWIHFSDEYDLVYGNVRAWRDLAREKRLLPIALLDLHPALFDDLLGPFWVLEGNIVPRDQEPNPLVMVKFVIDRGVSHALVRHRGASYSQESTHYVNYAKQGTQMTFVIPPWLESHVAEGIWSDSWTTDENANRWLQTCWRAELDYRAVCADSSSPAWKSQQARVLLPHSIKTELIMSARLAGPGSWRHILNLRALGKTGTDHDSTTAVMVPLLKQFEEKYHGF